MSDEPAVWLDFPTHWCPRHLEPFRKNWPAGAGVAMVRLAGLAFEHPDIAAAATTDADGNAKVESLNAVLREFSPLCCLVGDEAFGADLCRSGRGPRVDPSEGGSGRLCGFSDGNTGTMFSIERVLVIFLLVILVVWLAERLT